MTLTPSVAAALLAGATALSPAAEPPALPTRGIALDPDGDQPHPFYHAGLGTQAAPGTVLRQETVTNGLNVLGINDAGAYRARGVLYASTTRTGAPTSVSGLVKEPKAPWSGTGARPVVAYSPGTQGMADRCAPSRLVADGLAAYEQVFFTGLLKKGYAVAITDHEVLGTPGAHIDFRPGWAPTHVGAAVTHAREQAAFVGAVLAGKQVRNTCGA